MGTVRTGRSHTVTAYDSLGATTRSSSAAISQAPTPPASKLSTFPLGRLRRCIVCTRAYTRFMSMSISAARAALPAVIDRVVAGEEITLTRHGTPVAVLVRPDLLRARRSGPANVMADALRGLIEAGRHGELTSPVLPAERGEELVAHVRAGREGGIS